MPMSIANVFYALPTIWFGRRCHKRSSTIKNPSANNRIENKPFSSSNVSNSHHHCRSENGEKFYPSTPAVVTPTPTPTTTSAAILLSIALLAFPFLPAANLFFYVGFVVAERILYLPSVGYCLLIGLGVGKLIDSNHGPLSKRRKRYAIMLCVSIVLVAYSVKTIARNVDWHNEESLYRSAIQINPPKGNYHGVCITCNVCVFPFLCFYAPIIIFMSSQKPLEWSKRSFSLQSWCNFLWSRKMNILAIIFWLFFSFARCCIQNDESL